MNTCERFLRYIAISTPSNEQNAEHTPSSPCQFELADLLAQDMRDIGFANVRRTDNCFVYGDLPATPGMESLPVLGLIAHMDTAPAFNGMHVKPQMHPNYDGGDVLLPASGKTLSPARFPDLAALKG